MFGNLLFEGTKNPLAINGLAGTIHNRNESKDDPLLIKGTNNKIKNKVINSPQFFLT